jgi:hypothetical protein
MEEENPIEELKKRTGQQDDSKKSQEDSRNTLDLDSNRDEGLHLFSTDDEEKESVVKSETKIEVKRKPGKKFKPNPYEEMFHSEFCFMSLVLGFFGLVLPLFSVLAIIFGIGGLMQTHREHMKGKWMAIVGIILGFLGIIIIIVAIVFGISFLENYFLRFGGIETLTGAAHNYVN